MKVIPPKHFKGRKIKGAYKYLEVGGVYYAVLKDETRIRLSKLNQH